LLFKLLINSNIVGEDLQLKPYEEDDIQGWNLGSLGMYQRVNNLRKQNSKLKIMLSIGGWVL
jgi:GH18 family chitinase